MKKKNLKTPENRPSSGTMSRANAEAIIEQEGWELIPSNNRVWVQTTLINDIFSARPNILIIFPEGDDMVFVLRGQDIPSYQDKTQLINELKNTRGSLNIYHLPK